MSQNSLKISSFKSIGGALKQARQAKSLTLEEAACQMNIARRHIKAFEAGNIPEIAPIYIKGYLKSYAEFLGLDTVRLVEAWHREHVAANPGHCAEGLVPDDNSSAAVLSTAVKQKKSKVLMAYRIGSSWSNGLFNSPVGLLHMATSAALPLLLLCVVAFAYHAVDSGDANSSLPVIASLEKKALEAEKLGPLAHEAVASKSQVPETQPSLSVTKEQALSSLSNDRSAILPTLEAPSEQSSTIAYLDVLSEERPKSQSVAADERLIVDRQGEPALVTLESNTVKHAKNAIESSTLGAPGAISFISEVRPSGVITLQSLVNNSQSRAMIPNTAIEDSYEPIGPGAVEMIAAVKMNDRLVITVYEDSWVDVRDGFGGRLYRDLAKAGRRIDVSGRLPFSLHVGNAPGLDIELNGEPVEITRYRSDNSARLTLASN